MSRRDAFRLAPAGIAGVVAAFALLAPAQAAPRAPTGPTDLEVVDVTATSITLSWSEPQDTRGLYGYSVRDLGNPFVNNQVGWSFGTSATVEAEPATTYELAVRAGYIGHPDGIAESEPSESVTVATPPDLEPPATPDALAVVRKTATSVAFRKQLVDDNVGLHAPDYVIEVNGGERFVEVTSRQSGWGVRDLASNRTHTFRLKAIDAAGNESDWSEPVSVAIEDERPTAPRNLRVEGDVVAWDPSTDNSGAVRYEVFIDGDFRISNPRQAQDDFRFWREVAEAFGPGEHRFTVEAIDSSENRSAPSDPLVVVIG